MKKLPYILLMIAGMLIFSGCEDFLDVQPRGNAIAETTEHYNGLFNNINFMNMSLSESYYSFWKSDEHIFTPECYIDLNRSDVVDYPQSVMNAFQYKDKVYRDDENCAEWANCYKNIYTYNVITNGVMSATGSEIQKKYLHAEARVSRAYMHFLLAQWFAMPYKESTAATELAVPIVTIANTQVFEFERATVGELYSFVLSEMETYCPQLEERIAHKMRVYKATGYTMLGKVYWMMGKYDKAIAPLTEAKRLLENDPVVYFYDYNQTQASYDYKEVPVEEMDLVVPYIFSNHEVLFTKQNPLMLSYYFQAYDIKLPYLKPELYDLYDDHDLRRNLICTVDAFGNTLVYPYAGFSGSKLNLGVSLPELYLMLAESEARAGSEANARNVLLEYRKKRMRTGYEAIPGTVITREDLIRFCVDEQSREFMGTDKRWYTIRRLWDDPLFQSIKPVTHYDGTNTYTLQEAQLKLEIPETVLIWNENWR